MALDVGGVRARADGRRGDGNGDDDVRAVVGLGDLGADEDDDLDVEGRRLLDLGEDAEGGAEVARAGQ